MGASMRLLMMVGSFLTLCFVLSRIRKSKMQIDDTIFWLAFSFALLVLGIFPEIAFWCSRKLGFEAPINFVYLIVIFLLLLKQFSMAVKISQMDNQIRILTQRIALNQESIEHDKLD